MNDFQDFESIFKYRDRITSQTSIFISCKANELQELVDIMTANGYIWCSNSIPSTAIIECYMDKPLPGLVLYGAKSYYFNETSTPDDDVTYVLKFSDLMHADAISVKPEDIFDIIGG